MSHRYMVRMYEAYNQSGDIEAGTVVKPVDRHISIYASNSEEAEAALHRDVANQKLPAGKVYQVCPWLGNGELIRSLAFPLAGSSQRVFLDLVDGPYSELRRIRWRSRSDSDRDGQTPNPKDSLPLPLFRS